MGRKRKVFLDTNAIIYFLEGITGFEVLSDYKIFYYSFITEIELLSIQDKTQTQIIKNFLKRGKRIDINNKIISHSIKIRKTKKLKIPDAIIAASATNINADLYTSDEEILKKIDNINTINLLKEA